MKRFVLGTNIFIQAIRDAEARAELAAWQRSMAPYIWQHSGVAAELLVGAKDEATWRRWHERWMMPAERMGRVIAPAYEDWLRASRIISRLTEIGKISVGGVKPSFFNNCLLAAGAREHGYQIITHNREDFELIALAEPAVRISEPFP